MNMIAMTQFITFRSKEISDVFVTNNRTYTHRNCSSYMLAIVQ